jgi:putative serine protease PepD
VLSLLPATAAQARKNSPIDARRSVVTLLAGDRQGTAFAYVHRGELLTNAHVVRGSGRVDVVLRSGKRVSGRVTALDEQHDLATVEAPVSLPVLLPARGRPAIGSKVVAIGSPLGLSGSVSEGVVSAVRRRHGAGRLIQTDLSVNPGNSGGPLLDSRGRVIGVTSSRAAAGISFAVPISYAALLPTHPFTAASSSGSVSLLLIVGIALVALVLMATAFVLLRRRSRRPPPSIEVRIRPGTQSSPEVLPAPPRVFEPEPQVELKPRSE